MCAEARLQVVKTYQMATHLYSTLLMLSNSPDELRIDFPFTLPCRCGPLHKIWTLKKTAV